MVQYKDKEYELLDIFGLNITTSFIFSWRSRPNPPQKTSPRLRREVQQETYNPEGEVNAIQLQHLNATRRFWLRLYKHVRMQFCLNIMGQPQNPMDCIYASHSMHPLLVTPILTSLFAPKEWLRLLFTG